MAKVSVDSEEDELEKQWLQIMWYAVFLAIDESKTMFGIDAVAMRQEIARAVQIAIEEYASVAASSAVSTWKARYSEIVQDAMRRGLSAAEAEAGLKASSAAMIRRIRLITHDNIMNVFRTAIMEVGKRAGFEIERYESMPDADHFCLPYNGKVYKSGTGPIPPIHFGCKCVRFPISG